MTAAKQASTPPHQSTRHRAEALAAIT